MSFLKKIVEKLFPSKEQREQSEIIREAVKKAREERATRMQEYAEELTLAHGIDTSEANKGKITLEKIPTIRPDRRIIKQKKYSSVDQSKFADDKAEYDSFTTVDEDTRLVDLCMQFGDIQEFTLLENELVNVYLQRHREERDIVPLERALEVSHISKEDFDAMSDEDQKKYTSMTVAEYRQIREDEINKELFAETNPTVESMELFKKTMQENAERNLEEATTKLQEARSEYDEYEDPTKIPPKVKNKLQQAQATYERAKQLNDLVHDISDRENIANQFGVGELEQKYAKYANIPVFVLAAHNLLSSGGIVKRDRFNPKTLEEEWRKISDEKTRKFFEEFAGFTFENEEQPDGTVRLVKKQLVDEMGNPRKGMFEGLLYQLRKIKGDLVVNFSCEAIFKNAEYNQKLNDLKKECDEVLRTEISAQLLDDALDFANTVIESGKIDKERRVINKKTADAIIQSVENFASNVYGIVSTNVYNFYRKEYENFAISAISGLIPTLKGKESTFISDLIPTLEDKKITFEELLTQYRVDKFKPKKIDLMREYAQELAVIKDNAYVMRKLQNGLRLDLVSASDESQREKFIKEYNKSKQEIVKFNVALIKQVQAKERMRVFDYTIKQINYTSLNVATSVYETAVKQFEDELKKANDNLIIAKRQLLDLTTSRTIKVQQLYSTYLEADIRAIVRKINEATRSSYTLTDKEIRGLVKAASKKLGRAQVDEGLPDQNIDTTYTNLLQGFTREHLRRRFGKEPQIEVERAEQVADEIAAPTCATIRKLLKRELTEETNAERQQLLGEIASFDAEIKRRQTEIGDAEKIEGLSEEIKTEKESYDEKVLKAKRDYQHSISLVKKFEFEKYIQFLMGEKKYFEEQQEQQEQQEGIQIPFDKRNKKVIQAFNASREEFIAELSSSINSAKEKIDEILKVALDDFDLYIEIDSETGAPKANEGGRFEFRLIDNPTRVKGDVSEDAINLYNINERIRILELKPEELSADQRRLVDGLDLDDLKAERDEIVGRYSNPEDAQTKKLRKDYVRIQRYERGKHGKGKYVFLDAKTDDEEIIEADYQEIDSVLKGKALDSESMTPATEPTTTEGIVIPTADESPVTPGGSETETMEPRIATYPQDVIEFVDSLQMVKMADEALKVSTAPARKIELLKNLGFKDDEIDETGTLRGEAQYKLFGMIKGAKNPETGEHILGRQEIVEQTQLKVQSMDPAQQAKFIQNAVDYTISQQGKVENPEQERKDLEEEYSRILTPEQDGVKIAEKAEMPKLSEKAMLEGAKQKAKKIEYTAKGCELALKSINKLIEKLEKEIKAQKQAEAATETPVEEPPVTPAEEVVEEAHVETELNPSQKAMLRQAHLTMVHSSISAAIESLTAKQIMSLLESLNVEIDGEEIAGKDPKQITEYLESKGITLESQKSAIKVQVAFVKNGRVQEDGTIVDSRGRKVEKALYDRYDAGKPARSVEEFNSASSDRRKKYIARNVIIYALGRKVVSKEAVEAGAEQLAQILKEQGLEVTPDNINKMLSGQIKVNTQEGEVDAFAEYKKDITKKLEGITHQQQSEQGSV